MAEQPQEAEKLSGAEIARGLLVGLAGWVIPGAGHWLAGARGRALAFFALVVGTAALGIAFDGNLAVADARAPFLTRLQVVANLALGPAEPVLRTTLYGAPIYSNVLQSPRRPDAEKRAALEVRTLRFQKRWSGYGSTYLLVASLMNILIILDAWDLSIGRKR